MSDCVNKQSGQFKACRSERRDIDGEATEGDRLPVVPVVPNEKVQGVFILNLFVGNGCAPSSSTCQSASRFQPSDLLDLMGIRNCGEDINMRAEPKKRDGRPFVAGSFRLPDSPAGQNG